jgi:hypothetical protein
VPLPVTANFPAIREDRAIREDEMHKASIIVTLALMLSWIGTSAHSQTPPRPAQQDLVPTPRLNLTLEQRHTIKEFLKDLKTDATLRDVQAAVGEPIPQGVSPQPMPVDVARKVPQVRTHRFFITGQQIVIVDPKDNKVADVIKLGAD